MLSLGKDNMVKVTDSRTFQVQRQLRAPGFNVAGVWCKAAWGADERHVTAGSSDGTVFVWSVCPSSCLGPPFGNIETL